ncbi:MAG: DUF2267 domain-containing protein [Bacteriovoracaceae bacterium]|nr:DUF2267 domain-containing protein [Bacteriovoracaceae bacterium]
MNKELKGVLKANEEFNHVINLLMKSKVFTDEQKAFAVLKATMKALRDRITKIEAIHLGSQLSPLLRGFYYEGWELTHDISKSRTVDAFLNDVRSHFRGHDDVDLEKAVPVTLSTILEIIDQGEARQVLQNLPTDIQNLCLE